MSNYLKIGYFTAFPTCLDPFHGFDPDSYSVITAIHDSLTYINNDGKLEPALATSWKKISPLSYEFTLRENVFFHNGEKFNAEAVKETLLAQIDPKNQSPTGLGILSSIKNVEILEEYRVLIHTHFPDSMLPWRLAMFSAIVPPRVLKEKGVGYFKTHPIGTGAFIFESMEEGKKIVLRANENHWRGKPEVDGIQFLVMPSSYWVESLTEKVLDLVYGVHEVQIPLLKNIPHITIQSRLAAISHWFLLASKGPLSDTRVRIALNLAIDNTMIAKILGYTQAHPQASIATAEQFGFNEKIIPYPYDPEKAKLLLAEAGYANGFTLKGLVADHSASLIKIIEAYLSEVNIHLDYEIVPRAVWMDRIPNTKMTTGKLYEGDFALAPVDNPIMHAGFHHFIFLFSQGPFSLTQNKEYDKRFLDVMTQNDFELTETKLKELETFVHEQAFLLFTLQSSVSLAYQKGIEASICVNGHLDHDFWFSLKDKRTEKLSFTWDNEYLNSQEPIPHEEFLKLLRATEHSSMVWTAGIQIQDKRLIRLAKNLEYLESIKLHQDKFRFMQIVSFLHKVKDLDTILNASKFAGIASYNFKGELILCNHTFLQLFGKEINQRKIEELFFTIAEWTQFLETLNKQDGFFGSIHLKRTDNSILQAQLACTFRYDDANNVIGYLVIVRDESREKFLQAELEKSYLELEQKVIDRTAELKKSLEEIEFLKVQQDGDYFLTTLLLKPFNKINIESSTICIESFIKQKKSFLFKRQIYEIGGDINIVDTIYLRSKKYIVFISADAMGKSIQGAGGVIVLGSIFRSILARQSLNPREQTHYPERWIKVTVKELDLVFSSFDGSMLVSMVFGLIDEEKGFLYFVNAEYPNIVLYRDNKASFVPTRFHIRKIGFLEVTEPIYVNTFKMQPNDIILIGSDGKDDLVFSSDENLTNRTINDDPEIFLQTVEEANAELETIYQITSQKGKIIDDFSLLKICFCHVSPEATYILQYKNQLKEEINQFLIKKDYSSALNYLYKLVNKFPEDEKAIMIAAFCLYKLGNYNTAIDFGERIRLRNPNNIENLYYLSKSYFNNKQVERALQILHEGLRVSPTHPKLLKLKFEILSA